MPEQDLKVDGGQQPPLGLANGSNGVVQASGAEDGIRKTQKQDQHKIEELPPELAHITANFQPLSRLLERTAQECYNSLDETVTALANIPQHVNGEVTVNGASVVSGVNLQKRQMWMDFANSQRERFIKLLVLTRWSRQADDISKIIDLFAWMNQQNGLYEMADDGLATLRRELDGEKVPSPDLETALEVLATGHSTKMPDLNYIQPDPLSAAEILQTLQNINAILHLRLNIHEDLPHHLQNFRISSGRVTFTISNEFEMDLSIADEDPTSQFFFIDFRFLFSPSSEIPAGNVRAQFEARANEVLATEGLVGCYDLFHDFVLTHKINILCRQAINLNRNSWAGSLSIEQVHRSLVIQYWGDKPGPKNWIEIGVAANRSKKTKVSSNTPVPQPELRAKWIRAGKEVQEKLFDFNQGNLDFTNILRHFVARHCEYILSSLALGCLDVELVHDEANASMLVFPIFQDDAAALRIEPTSRSFHLSPVSAESQACERELNALERPWLEGANVLNNARPLLTLSAITSTALAAGWMLVLPHTNSSFPHSRRTWLANAQSCAFRPSSWEDSTWAIGVTVDSSAQIEWSVCELFEKTAQRGGTLRPLKTTALTTLDLPNVTSITDTISYAAAGDAARSLIYFQSIISYCQQHLIQHHAFQPISDLDGVAQHITHDQVTIDTSSFVRDDHAAHYLSDDLILSVEQSSHYLLKGFLKGSDAFLSKLSKLLSASTDIKMTPSGAFALRAPGGIGAVAEALQQFRTHLRWLSRLPPYFEILSRRGFKCTALSMEGITFAYARIASGNDDDSKTIHCSIASNSSLRHPAISLLNTPHKRLTTCFATMLSAASHGSDTSEESTHALHIQAFSRITAALTYTRPLMLAFDTLEQKVSMTVSLAIRPRTSDRVSLEYRDIAANEIQGVETARKLEVSIVLPQRPGPRDQETQHAGKVEAMVLLKVTSGKIPADVVEALGDVKVLKSGSVVCKLDDVVRVLDKIDEAMRLPPPPPPLPKEEVAIAPKVEEKTVEIVEID